MNIELTSEFRERMRKYDKTTPFWMESQVLCVSSDEDFERIAYTHQTEIVNGCQITYRIVVLDGIETKYIDDWIQGLLPYKPRSCN